MRWWPGSIGIGRKLTVPCKLGATWAQIAEATGSSEAQVRRDYRDWAEGQHRLWTGELGGSAGRFGMNDAGYAAAIARVEAGQ